MQLINFGVAPRYCLRELCAVFLVVFMVLMLISLGSRFTGYLQDAAAGELAAEVLWSVLALKMPDFIQIVVPFSLYLAMLLTIGRLDADSEMPILQMAKVGPIRLLAWFGWFVVPLIVVVGYLSFVLTPEARASFLALLSSQEVVSEFDVIKADKFHTFDNGTRVSYMASVDRDAMSVSGVFMNSRTPTGDVTLLAERGQYHIDPTSGVRYLELIDGRRYTSSKADAALSVTSFDTLTQRIEMSDVQRMRDDPSRIPTIELNSTIPSERMEWHWRLALPIMTGIVAIIAVGLGRIKPRSGRFGKILPGLLLFVLYYGLLLGSLNQLQHSVVWSAMGFWPVHALMLALGIYLVRKNWRPA